MPRQSYDVVIVGAGPAGIFAALELGRLSKLKIAILEKGVDPDYILPVVPGDAALQAGKFLPVAEKGLGIEPADHRQFPVSVQGNPGIAVTEPGYVQFSQQGPEYVFRISLEIGIEIHGVVFVEPAMGIYPEIPGAPEKFIDFETFRSLFNMGGQVALYCHPFSFDGNDRLEQGGGKLVTGVIRKLDRIQVEFNQVD